MRIITPSTLYHFAQKHNDADVALREWVKKVNKAQWQCFADIKATFNSVDSIGNSRFIFNIKGNNYRIVAKVLFIPQMVYIRFVGTHSDYDKIDCKNNLRKLR